MTKQKILSVIGAKALWGLLKAKRKGKTKAGVRTRKEMLAASPKRRHLKHKLTFGSQAAHKASKAKGA